MVLQRRRRCVPPVVPRPLGCPLDAAQQALDACACTSVDGRRAGSSPRRQSSAAPRTWAAADAEPGRPARRTRRREPRPPSPPAAGHARAAGGDGGTTPSSTGSGRAGTTTCGPVDAGPVRARSGASGSAPRSSRLEAPRVAPSGGPTRRSGARAAAGSSASTAYQWFAHLRRVDLEHHEAVVLELEPAGLGQPLGQLAAAACASPGGSWRAMGVAVTHGATNSTATGGPRRRRGPGTDPRTPRPSGRRPTAPPPRGRARAITSTSRSRSAG